MASDIKVENDKVNAMKKVCDIEYSYISLLLNEKEAINYSSIKGEWFINKSFGRVYDYIINTYKKEGFVILPLLIENNPKAKDDIELLVDLSYTDTPMINSYILSSDISKMVEAYEIQIIDRYKYKIIEGLETKHKNKEITYKEYINQIKKLDEIRNDNNNVKSVLSINDIDTKEEDTIKVKSNTIFLDDKITGFALGELSVWSGSNGSAKSTYLNQLMLETINQGFNTFVYSGELTPQRYLGWITEQCAGSKHLVYEPNKNKFVATDVTKEKIANWLEGKLYIYNNVNGNKVSQVTRAIRQYIKQYDVKVIFIDNLMSMDLTEYSSDRYEAQSMFAKDLMSIAHDLKVHIHFVCHPRKSTGFLRKTDISGSADLSNSADNVFIVHRVNEDFKKSASEFLSSTLLGGLEKFSNVVEICKHRETGTQDAFIGMYYDPKCRRLLNSPDEERKYGWEK